MVLSTIPLSFGGRGFRESGIKRLLLISSAKASCRRPIKDSKELRNSGLPWALSYLSYLNDRSYLSYMTYLSYLCLAPSCLAPLLLGSGSLAPWLLSSLANRLPGSLSPWLGCLTPWLPGSLATLLPGCLAPWLTGSWLVGCLAPGRPETVPREDPADLGSGGQKRTGLQPQSF